MLNGCLVIFVVVVVVVQLFNFILLRLKGLVGICLFSYFICYFL